jgi:hypothetical protein
MIGSKNQTHKIFQVILLAFRKLDHFDELIISSSAMKYSSLQKESFKLLTKFLKINYKSRANKTL